MALDFLQVSQQVKQMGEKALGLQQDIKQKLDDARVFLDERSNDVLQLQQKVHDVVSRYDPTLRCAVPVIEPLNSHHPLPRLPGQVSIIAADGSQIFADRHAEVEYCLVNTGAIWMTCGSPEAPQTSIQSKLIYADELEGMSDDRLSLQRDLAERTRLLEIALQLPRPVITLTDGPLELWTTTLEEGKVAGEFKKALETYLDVLRKLCEIDASTAGYVDKPGSDLLVRLLEVSHAEPGDLPQMRSFHPFSGVTDRALLEAVIKPGERSAIFTIQSRSSQAYKGELGLHFFYLNVGTEARSYLARVEIPAWVADDEAKLNSLHAVLVSQSRMIGNQAYPYLLHRAHETAVVSLEDRDQVTQMIVNELRKRGLDVTGKSAKQFNKDVAGKRTRYGE